MLHRDDDAWKILAIGILQYDIVVDDVAKLYAFEWAPIGDAGAPPQTMITAPPDRAAISDAGTSIQWHSAADAEGPLLRLLVQSWETHPGLPAVSLTLLPEDAESGEAALMTARRMVRTTIWSVNATGRVTFSPVVTWHPAEEGDE